MPCFLSSDINLNQFSQDSWLAKFTALVNVTTEAFLDLCVVDHDNAVRTTYIFSKKCINVTVQVTLMP